MNEISTLVTEGLNRPEPTNKPDSHVTRKLFLLMHGAYGNLFTSKFSTGEKDANGKDKGIRAAMMVWESTLSKYPPDVVETAARRLSSECPDYPPNLPQFESICRAVMPRKTYAEENHLPRLPAPEKQVIGNIEYEARKDGKDWARRILARQKAGEKMNPTSLLFARQGLGLAR